MFSHVESLPQVQPLDEHNRRLVDNVHPATWTNPQPQGRYNMVVVGGGTAGLVTAAGAAGLGAKVALIERGLLGGDCLNVGCVPSKALLRSAAAAADVRDASAYGIDVQGRVSVEFSRLMQRMRKLRAGLSPHDSAARFQQLGVDVYFGQAAFTGHDRLRVEGRELVFARCCIATGASPQVPDIPGLVEAGYLTNETLFSLTELPRRLVVLGGGPVGCEMAQAFARFGAEVTLLERSERILRREDADAGGLLDAALRRDGVGILLQARVSSIKSSNQELRLSIEKPGGPMELVTDRIVVGAGRVPNVRELNLEAAGVEYDDHGVHVNDFLQTRNRRIYAAGDICSSFKFTHAADAMARIVIQNALFFGRARMSRLTIPWCTYTDPEIAHVGWSPGADPANDAQVTTLRQNLDDVDRAVLDGEESGFLKIHLRRGSDRILGGILVARHAGEMIGQLCLAMTARIGLKTLARTIQPYPTQAEVFRKVADTYNRSRLTPRLRSALTTFLTWRRR